MIGPTGVGKTEIARRLAALVGAPFVKVEATKYTEVGYVGRDVESMVRDLVEAAIRTVNDERRAEVREVAEHAAVERIIDVLHPETRAPQAQSQAIRSRPRWARSSATRSARRRPAAAGPAGDAASRRRTSGTDARPKRAPRSSAASTTCA